MQGRGPVQGRGPQRGEVRAAELCPVMGLGWAEACSSAEALLCQKCPFTVKVPSSDEWPGMAVNRPGPALGRDRPGK